MRDGYGPNLGAFFAYYDPDTHSLNASQDSFLKEGMMYSETLPPSGILRNGKLYQRRPLAPRTSATGFSLWPTPVADGDRKTMYKQGGTPLGVAVRFPTPTNSMMTIGDQEQARFAGNDPRRPNYKEANKLWPTPTARLGTQRGAQAKRYSDPARSNDLDDAVAATGNTGQLNADWVSLLMGLPADWTIVEDGSVESQE